MKRVSHLAISVALTIAHTNSVFAQTPAGKPPPAKSEAAPTNQGYERRIRSLEAQVRSLQSRVAYKFATLDCNTGKYDEFQFAGGSLTYFAACTKIEPYLEGHKITISIGNPYAFTFSNVKGSLNYGKDWEDQADKKVEISFTDTLRGGAWNTLVVTVNPSKPEEMRLLNIELNAQTAGSGR
ncbi:MAG: hypothetical protein JNN20_17950 [Betaproteobacteria bacterium]|nr:hypothetical protein [Betaproteobacteria bacterium]